LSGVKYFKAIGQKKKERRRGIFEDPQGQDYSGGTTVLPQNSEIMSCVALGSLTEAEGAA
jgi:hypothetical protein